MHSTSRKTSLVVVCRVERQCRWKNQEEYFYNNYKRERTRLVTGTRAPRATEVNVEDLRWCLAASLSGVPSGSLAGCLRHFSTLQTLLSPYPLLVVPPSNSHPLFRMMLIHHRIKPASFQQYLFFAIFLEHSFYVYLPGKFLFTLQNVVQVPSSSQNMFGPLRVG